MKHTADTQKKKGAGRSVPVAAVAPGAGAGEKNTPGPGFFSLRSLLLALLLLGFLGVLRQMKLYQKFFAETIDEAYEKMPLIRDLDNYQDLKKRKEMRWGYSYYWMMMMKDYLKNDPEAIVLLPPNDYIETINSAQTLPEPAVGYYYSGLKTSWGTSNYAYRATHYYKPNRQGGPSVIPITSKAQIDSLLQLYKGYVYSY